MFVRWVGLRFDEDALAGAFLGGFHNEVHLSVGDLGKAFGAFRIALGRGEDLVAFANVGETIVEQDKYIGGDFFAEAVSRAKVLVDPDFHWFPFSGFWAWIVPARNKLLVLIGIGTLRLWRAYTE